MNGEDLLVFMKGNTGAGAVADQQDQQTWLASGSEEPLLPTTTTMENNSWSSSSGKENGIQRQEQQPRKVAVATEENQTQAVVSEMNKLALPTNRDAGTGNSPPRQALASSSHDDDQEDSTTADNYDEDYGDDGFEEEDDDDQGIMMVDRNELITTEICENGVPPPPDGGWGWVIVCASFLISLVMDGVTSSFGVLLPQIVDEFREAGSPDIGRSDVAWAGSLLCGVSLCIGPIISALTNKYGCRIVCVIGALISCVGFIGAAYSFNLELFLLTYGLIGGIGFGMLYLPAIICVSYYFESKRARATGIAISGSGFGAVTFAPAITSLAQVADWRMICIGFGMMLGALVIAGLAMKPLAVKVIEETHAPLLQRMADEKKKYLEKCSVGGSDFFMVQLPDGTMEKRVKMGLNVDPGVHSGLYLDQLFMMSGIEGSPTPVLPAVASHVDILPTITEMGAGNTRSRGTTDSNTQESSGEDLVSNDIKPKSHGVNVKSSSVPIKESHPARISPPSVSTPVKIPASAERAAAVDHTKEKRTPNSPPTKSSALPEATSPRSHISQIKPAAAGATPPRRQRRVSDGEQLPSSPPSTEFTRNRSGTEIIKRSTVHRSFRLSVHNGSFPSTKGSVGQIGGEGAVAPSMMRKGSIEGTQGSVGEQQSPGGITATPKERKYSIRAVPSSTSFRSRKDSFDASSVQFRTSASTLRESRRRELGIDETTKLLLSKGEFSQLGSSLTKKGSETDTTKFVIRPMSRKDIFYSGSIHKLPVFQSQNLSGYRQSVLNLPKKFGGGGDEEQQRQPEQQQHRRRKLKPRLCSSIGSSTGAFMATLTQMLDFRLLKNPAFLVIAISGVIGMLGFYVPIVYAIDFGAKKGIDEKSAAWFISVVGITSVFGRIGFGLLSDLKRVDSLLVYNLCTVVMGVVTCALPFCFNYYLLLAMYTIFGTAVSGFVALSSIILVKLLGLENLTNAFGLLIFFRGVSTVIGTPLSGAIYDSTKSYDIPFYLAGALLLLSAIVSFLGPYLSKYYSGHEVIKQVRKSSGAGQQPLEDILEEVVESTGSGSIGAHDGYSEANENGGGKDKRDAAHTNGKST